MQLSTAILSLILTSVVPALAENTVFPWANDTKRPECKTCLDELVSDTCGGESSSNFHTCLCDGAGATRLKDKCYPTCCNSSTMCTGQGPYREWWLLCVDDYPGLCSDPPSAIGPNTDLEKHCTRDEVDAANDAKDDSNDDAKDDVKDRTFENGDVQSDLDRDSSASVLGVYPRITGGAFGLVLFAAMMQIN
ncbi:hypothetical protein FAVG1_08475 [Fusarium avenaceum]|nr:hypothetical protein FAVG1_08475 [Fusarium avenaceum]